MKSWQIQVGIWGFLIWLGAFQLGEYLMKTNQEDLSLTSFGYISGFITTFAGILFWDYIVRGRLNDLLGDGCIIQIFLAIFSLIIVLGVGFCGFYIGIFGSNSWHYNLFFAIGSFVTSQGFMPIVYTLFGKDK